MYCDAPSVMSEQVYPLLKVLGWISYNRYLKTEFLPHSKYFSLHCMYRLVNPYPTAFPYGNGMVLHFYQQQESSMTKTVHKVINKGLKTYV